MTWIVRGVYCPTDANPETDTDGIVTEIEVETEREADHWLLWFPGGEKIEQ